MSDLGIDGFVDAEEIGRGGFGIVFRARQPALNRWVAIKMLAASLSADGRERLGHEARVRSEPSPGTRRWCPCTRSTSLPAGSRTW